MTDTKFFGPCDWSRAMPLERHEVDCVVAVMLKILDGKCQMDGPSKKAMESFYDAVKSRPGQVLPVDVREVIATARISQDPEVFEQIHRQRVLAESLIPRPQMKAFKARLRRDGFLPASIEDNAP